MIRDLATEVKTAFTNAPSFSEDDLAAMPDITNCTDDKNKVIVDTPEELFRLLRVANYVLDTDVSEQWMTEVIGHEEEHAEAIRVSTFGPYKLEYCLTVARLLLSDNESEYGIVLYQPAVTANFELTQSSLAISTIALHPTVPSDSDIAYAAQHGYHSFEQLIGDIDEHNFLHDTTYPMPRSWQ